MLKALRQAQRQAVRQAMPSKQCRQDKTRPLRQQLLTYVTNSRWVTRAGGAEKNG